MMFDAIEKNSLDNVRANISEKLGAFNKTFQSSIAPEAGAYVAPENAGFSAAIAENLGLQNSKMAGELKVSALRAAKNMYEGKIPVMNGDKLEYIKADKGIKEIGQMKINKDHKYANYKQQAGFAAEVLSTTRENFIAQAEGTGTVTVKVDDLVKIAKDDKNSKLEINGKNIKELVEEKGFVKNDPYADKIRIFSNGETESVQTKFVGDNARNCFTKLKSQKYDKYFKSDKVDKLEIPKEYYNDIKNRMIPAEKAKLQEQIEKLSAKGKTEKMIEKQNQLEKIQKIDAKLEQSTITSDEALTARTHGRWTAVKTGARQANKSGISGAKGAAALTAVVSTVDNGIKLANGDITAKEMAVDVVKDTAEAGVMGYGLGLVTGVTRSNAIAAGITMGISSYGDVKDFVQGDISGKELAYNLGENAASITGAIIGGSVGGLVGGVAGSYLATKAYDVSTEFVADNVGVVIEKGGEVLDKAGDIAIDVKDAAAEKLDVIVDKAGDVKDAAAEKLDVVADKAADVKDAAAEKLDVAKDKAVDLKNTAAEKASGLKGKAANLIHKF